MTRFNPKKKKSQNITLLEAFISSIKKNYLKKTKQLHEQTEYLKSNTIYLIYNVYQMIVLMN